MSDRINRREMFKLAVAGAGGAGLYKGLEHVGAMSAWAVGPADASGSLASVYESLGRWILLAPQKLGGGSHAVDLSTGRGLAWISYWNYGDTCPISHHLAAYPSDDPYKGFEFVNSTQGGENVLIYGIPTRIKEIGMLDKYGQGNHIYRVRFNGQQMELVEDISETTGIGLGVHTVIYPDANGFSCSDGQKDVAATLLQIGVLYSAVLAERRQELGLLLTLGAHRAQVVRMVLAEAGLTTCLGGLGGLLLGVVLLIIFQHTLWQYLDILEVPLTWPSGIVIGVAAVGCLAVAAAVGPLGAALPAWRLCRRDPYNLARGGAA